MSVRDVRPADLPDVLKLVYELAEYERLAANCHLTEEQLHTALFGPAPALFGHVAELDGSADGADGTVVGFTLWFLNFSTWRGVHGIYLEDLYVRPEHRGSGLGRALLTRLAQVCLERGYGRLEWSVLDWNESALRFYRTLGAVAMDEWTVNRIDGDALAALGRPDGS